MTITLEIGGYRLEFKGPSGLDAAMWPTEAFSPFEVIGGRPADLRFEIRATDSLPQIAHDELVFDAGRGLWKLWRSGADRFIETLCPATGSPLNRAVVSEDFTRIVVHSLSDEDGAWLPTRIINPLAEICLLTHLAREGGLLLHAAGLDWGGRGLVFAGPSGAGKSTLSALVARRGALLLNDERVIVRGAVTAPVVHGTPWCGSIPTINKAHAPLKGLYFIRHGRGENRLAPLPAAKAASLCVKQAFLPYWDPRGMEATMASAEKLAALANARDFAFLHGPGAVDALLEGSSSHAQGLAAELA